MLIERSFGDYEGKKINFDLIALQWNLKLNDNSHNKTILLVSHGSFIKALHFNLIN